MNHSQLKSTPSQPNNLRVRMYWGDLLYDTILVPKGGDVSAGRDRRDTFMIPLDRRLSSGRWNFVRRLSDGSIEIRFHSEQSGHVKAENRMIALREAAQHPNAAPTENGLVRLRLEKGSEARLVSGDSSFYIDWVEDAPRIPRASKETWRELGTTSAIGSALLLLLWALPQVLPTPKPEAAPPERLVQILNEADFVKPIPEAAPPAPEPEPVAPKPVVVAPKPATRPPRARPSAKEKAVENPPTVAAASEPEDIDLSGVVEDLTRVPASTASSKRKENPLPRVSSGRSLGSAGFGTKELARTAQKTVGLDNTEGQGSRDVSQTEDVNLKSPRIVRHGGLTQDEVDRVIRGRQPAVRRCYERALAAAPELSGLVRVQFTVGAAGTVTRTRVAEDTLKKSSVTQCVLNEIKSFKFPNPDGGRAVAVDLPLRFEPDSN